MGRSNHSVETALVRDKAQRLSNPELEQEIARCRRGMQIGANATARARFERRLHIMQDEADARVAQTGGAA